jgi:hypothetical protein
MRSADKIKRLVRATSFKARPQADAALWARVLREYGGHQASNRTPEQHVLGRLVARLWTGRTHAAAILAVGMVIGVAIGSTLVRLQTDPASQADSPSGTHMSEGLQPDIFSMRQMAAAQDVKGLAAILADGRFESRLLAANLLARMAPLPALETVSMHFAGELRADRQGGNLRLYSTGHSDWLELADSTITVHAASVQQKTTLVRLTPVREGAAPGLNARLDDGRFDRYDPDRLRKDKADIEKRLANPDGLPGDANQLRSRIAMYNRMLDSLERAIYVSPAHGGLHVQGDQIHSREIDLFPSDSGVRAEWHGVTMDANGITLRGDQLTPVRTDGPLALPAGWRDRFDQAYSLADGEVLRWVRPPFIPERQYHMQERPLDSKASPGSRPQSLSLSFRWDGALHASDGGAQECTLASVLRDLGRERGLRRYEMGGPIPLLQLRLTGDWIVRANTSMEQRVSALERVLERELERSIRCVRKSVEREVIVVRGRYERRPLEGRARTDPVYLLAETDPCEARILGPSTQASVAELLHRVGERFNRPIIVETQGLDEVSVQFVLCMSYLLSGKKEPVDGGPFPIPLGANLDPVLANLARQTSLEFSRQMRSFDTWLVTEVGVPDDANADRRVRR